MTSRLLCFVALIATITTSSTAFQCYDGFKGTSIDTTTCPSDWCMTTTTLSGVVQYSCDTTKYCTEFGSGCTSNKIVHNYGFQSLCCCQTKLCNGRSNSNKSATLHTQLIFLGVISFIVTKMLCA
uniref:Uncharacterized protein n=1 Tax=Plectus sambesii TaxID=2011161 RepID=A0A914W3Q5_9BILA